MADADGTPLAPCVMGADTRGAEFETLPEGTPTPEPWCFSCGHLRERMDPVLRLMWWRRHHPEIVERACHFLGWHDFLALRMCGRIATDRSTASRYLIYDLASNDWAPDRVAEYELDPGFLPQVLP